MTGSMSNQPNGWGWQHVSLKTQVWPSDSAPSPKLTVGASGRLSQTSGERYYVVVAATRAKMSQVQQAGTVIASCNRPRVAIHQQFQMSQPRRAQR
jgi:hypothetical protein